QLARGISYSQVVANRLPKSLGAERTFSANFTSIIPLKDKLLDICKEVSGRLQKRNVSGKTITLKIKYSDFTLQTKSHSLPYYISSSELIEQSTLKTSVRLIGVQVSNLNINKKKPVYIQLKFRF